MWAILCTCYVQEILNLNVRERWLRNVFFMLMLSSRLLAFQFNVFEWKVNTGVIIDLHVNCLNVNCWKFYRSMCPQVKLYFSDHDKTCFVNGTFTMAEHYHWPWLTTLLTMVIDRWPCSSTMVKHGPQYFV